MPLIKMDILFSFLSEERLELKMKETGKGGFQDKLKRELKQRYPGCFITKLDSSDIQGIPDLLILHGKKWGTLEVKKSAKAKKQPNQEYYVNLMDEMSFSKFIYPENKDEVLNELDTIFKN